MFDRAYSIHTMRKTTLSVFISTYFFFFSSRRRHTRCLSDWNSDVCSSDLAVRDPVDRRAVLTGDQGESKPRVLGSGNRVKIVKAEALAGTSVPRGVALRRAVGHDAVDIERDRKSVV